MAAVTLSTLFGLRVRELREATGLSQEAFANKYGFARSYMSKIERGRANVALDAIQRLAEGLAVEPKALFEPPSASAAGGGGVRRAKSDMLVPFAADGSCFNPTIKQPRAGTFVVGDKATRHTFTEFRDALSYLRKMKPAKWWRPNKAGNWGVVTEVRWAPLPDVYRK